MAAVLILAGLTLARADTARVTGVVTADEGELPGDLVLRLQPVDDSAYSVELRPNKKGRFTAPSCPKGTFTIQVVTDGFAVRKLAFSGRSPQGERVAEFEETLEQGDSVPSFQLIPGLRARLTIELTPIDPELTRGVSVERARADSPKLVRLNELFERQDWQNLIVEAEAIVTEAPDLGGAWYLLAVGLWRTERLKDAVRAMDTALEHGPDQPRIHETAGALRVQYGQELLAADRVEEAREVFAGAIAALDLGLEENPGSLQALTNRVIALDASGRVEETIAALDLLIEHDPEPLRAYLHKAELLTDSGRTDEALAVIDSIPAGSVGVADALYNTAVELFNRKQIEAAVSIAGRAIELQPDLAVAYRLQGRALLQLGRDDEGLTALRRYLSMVPEDDPAAAPDRALVEALGGGS